MLPWTAFGQSDQQARESGLFFVCKVQKSPVRRASNISISDYANILGAYSGCFEFNFDTFRIMKVSQKNPAGF